MQRTVKFVPIRHGDKIEIGNTGIVGVSGDSKLVGFKPGRAGKREGWLVVLSTEKDAPKKIRSK